MFISDITPESEVLRRLNDIKHRLESGEADFATMARLNSVDNSATRGGDLGWVQAGDTLPAFEDAMNRLKPGEISDPIRTQYGYHLIKVEERRLNKNGNPQRMRLAARQALRQRKLAEAAFNWQRELRDRAYVEIRNQEAY
ncbi:sura domain-containing protein [gut metagenome]|uniref:Sura domain-containing protein n=1 Tax=gut metagenome TaxID=749906 RepID=J9GGK7_9ZZZZ